MTGEIDPALVKWEEDYPDTYFGPKRSDWVRMSAMFSGENPYAVVETPDEQAALKEMVRQMPDPAAEERKIAVTAYMSRMKRQNIDFVYDNLDGILKDYYGRKTNVDEAFRDISGMLLRGRGDDAPKEGEDIFLSAGSGIAGAVDFGLSVAKFFARYAIPHDVTKDNPFEEFVKTVRKPVKEYRASLSEWAKTKTLEEAWNEGETGKNLVKLVAEEGPSLAEQIGFIYLTGGAGPFLMGGVLTDDKREQLLEENPEMSLGQLAANLSATYVINTVDALIDRGLLKGASAPLKKELTESVFYAFRRIVAPTFIEGGTEGLQRLAENVTDYLTGVYDKEIEQGAKVSGLLTRGVPEEALLGAFGGAGMSALGFSTVRDIDRANTALITTVDSTIERLRAKESLTDTEEKQLKDLEEMRDAGNAEGMRSVLVQRAIGEHNRIQREQSTDAKNESEMTADDFAEQARVRYRQRHAELAHNPEETLAAVTEASKLYPDYEFQCFDGAENIPDAARQEASRRGLDVRGVDAVIIGDTCYVNAAKLRPSDVPKRVLEEVAGHRGIRAVFGEQYDSMLDGVYRDFFETEEFREVVQRYFRGRELESVDDQRYATEEFLAHNARMRPELKPSWWKDFLERVKMTLRKLPGFQNLRFTDRELERILIRGIGAVRKGKSEGNTRFSVAEDGNTAEARPYYQIPFSEGLARVVDPAQKDKREPVFVCTTPEIMRKIGFTALPIMMNARHLRLNYYTAEEFREHYGNLHKEDHAHGLHETLKILPKVLEHPLAILVNKTPNATPGSIVCITDVNVGGKKIVVPLLIETVSGADKHRIDSHLVLTVYDSDNWVDTFLKPALEEEKKKRVGIFYFDKEKAKRYSAGSKNPGGIPSGVVHTIHDEWSPVKGEFKKQTETLQFKEWFGKSKVVDEEGKPLVVYHGTDSDFTVFDMDKTRSDMDIRGAFFSPYEDEFIGYGKNVRAFYLSIQKPATAEQAYKALRMFQGEKDAGTKARDYLIKQGYDGVIDEGYEYIAFYPEQVKSAADNIGTFDPENPDIRFSIIGEEGAGRGREAEKRMSDLRIAREMESAGKDAKTIKRATGWERGGDGKWRMEIPDLKIKREETLPDGTTYAKSEFSLKFHDGALGEYVDAPELFEAYPELRNIRLAVRPEEMSDTGFSYGYFDKSRNMIVVYSDVSHAEEFLVHEVQHAIQTLEGFPGGGDGRTGAEYRKLAGEVEAYNAAKRRKMTAEEKRESLLEETADVAEEDKIYLTGAQGLEHSFPYADRYTLENAKASKEGYRVERVNENAGRDLTEAQGVVCEVNQVFNPEEAPEGQFIGWMAKKVKAYEKAHSLVGTYDTPALGKNVEVRKSTIRSISNHGGPDEKFNLYPAVPDMLHNAVLIQSEANIDENTQAIRSYSHILASKVRYGEKRFVAIMVIHESDKICYYDYSILLIDNGALQMPEEWRTGKKKAAENGSPATAGPSSHTAQVLKVAREALLSSGFDTKSEKNLRFSIEQYSDADWSDMVTYMKAKVGDLLTKSDAEYKKMLESVGMECYSDADAHVCAAEAMNANLKDAQARRKAEMMNWIVENNAWIQRIAEVTGSPEFKIRPSYRFQGMDFTGAYISQAWRDCSGNPKAKNREKRLREASGYHSDELAQMIADKYGGDAIEIENDLIEYFQHKKKKASKTERENGELGVYDEYYAFKKEERLFNRELDRQMQEQWESQEAVRIGDEIRNILEEKRVIGEDLAETDFELFASLYQQVTGERAPAHPSAEQLDALNMAIQEGGVTQAYIRGWEAGRDRMLAEKRKEFAEFTAKVMQEKTAMKEHYKEQISKEREKRRKQADKFAAERANIREANLERQEELARDNAQKLHLQREANLERQEEMVRDDADKLYLQRQAEEFAKKNVPAEQRGEFIRGIVDLAKYSYLPTKKYPNGQRKAKLQELFERMAARGEEVRKERLIAEVEKLFKQAGLRADSGRKQRNLLSFDVQRIVDRCREYADLSAEEAEILSAEMAQRIDNSELTGNAQADLEYEARLLDLFGNYRGKSAAEIERARAELKTLVNTGRSELKQQIRERVQADGLARSNITAGLLNGENPLTPQQRRALEAKRKREKTKRVLAETNWKSNSLDSLLSYLELPSGVKVETVEELQRKLYRSNDGKMTRSRKHAWELEAKLNEFCGVDPAKKDSFTARKARAELIRKWRERPEKTGIIRGQPNEMTQYMKWVRVPAEEAHAKLKEFQAQGREVEAAALEHLLNTERLRIKRGDVTSGDAVTDALVKEMRKMQESDQDKAYFIPELRLGANPVEEKLTQLEALYMRLMWGQKNVKYKMRFNGWTESSMKQIDAYLKPEVKEFGEWMVKQLERDRTDIEAVYEKLYFSMFPHEENYFPSVYNPTRETIDGRMTTDLSQEGAGKQPMAYTPGAVKLRAFHLMEPKICDALNVFVNHRMQMDHFVTHGETSRELRSIFANRDVAQTIRDVYGGEYYDQLRKEISDFIHGGNTEVQNTQFAQMALNNFTRMKMLWNLVSAGKQVFGGVSYFAFSGVPAKAMASGIADFWKHPAANAKNLRETEYFKNRWQGGMNREMKAIMDSTGLCAGNMQLFMRELDYAGFMLMRAGDALSVLVYGHAIYKYHYDQLVKQGMAPHEADVKAKEEWALATERTQQSGAPHMLNTWQKGNFAQKALVSFLSNPTLLFQSYSRDIYSQKRFGHGGWSAAKKIAVAGICSVLMSAINQMIRNGDDWDEYSLSDAVFSVLNDITVGWVGVGTLMSGIYDALSYGRAKTIPVLDDAGRAVRSGYRIAGEMAEGDLNEENLRDAIALLQGLGLFWSPAAQVSALGREGRRWWQFFTGEKK